MFQGRHLFWGWYLLYQGVGLNDLEVPSNPFEMSLLSSKKTRESVQGATDQPASSGDVMEQVILENISEPLNIRR